ncbi:hypothetical protein GE118_00525 [Mycoplasma sp. NEAQ87857]|uniref:GA module-containing protein n=1 Tax=Mycoplasma sp. NEAQ87857 TaxID=2683967 RepID=UPI0013168CD4|nr:GA module-containing protein [Mycoplasma sp. NEAQ87857]QGZ97289.1 hypothetical protein GE118_00525 [Mycoplasma sp. NEAQ87857]
MKKIYKFAAATSVVGLSVLSISISRQNIDINSVDDAFSDSKTTRLNLNDWMKDVNDNKKFTELNIPGTHDSGMWAGNGIAWAFGSAWAKTQSKSWVDQLKQGIRFFDIRVNRSRELWIIHGAAYSYYENLSTALDAFKKFLKAHPSETVIVRVKDENYSVKGPDREWGRWFENVINSSKYSDVMYQNTSRRYDVNPSLKELRGKIFILNHMHHHISQDYSHGRLYRTSLDQQDEYDTNEDTKVNKVIEHVKRVNNSDDRTYSVNFFSRANGEKPWYTAGGVNRKVLKWMLTQNNLTKLGIVPMDYPGDSLVLNIVKTNYYLSDSQLSRGYLGRIIANSEININNVESNTNFIDINSTNLDGFYAEVKVNNTTVVSDYALSNSNKTIRLTNPLPVNGRLQVILYKKTAANIYYPSKKYNTITKDINLVNNNTRNKVVEIIKALSNNSASFLSRVYSAKTTDQINWFKRETIKNYSNNTFNSLNFTDSLKEQQLNHLYTLTSAIDIKQELSKLQEISTSSSDLIHLIKQISHNYENINYKYSTNIQQIKDKVNQYNAWFNNDKLAILHQANEITQATYDLKRLLLAVNGNTIYRNNHALKLNEFTNLSTAIINHYVDLILDNTVTDNFENIVNEAKQLNNLALYVFGDITKYSSTTTQDYKYLNSSSNLQEIFKQNKRSLENLASRNKLQSRDTNEINRILETIKQSYNNLDGDTLFNNKKQDILSLINNDLISNQVKTTLTQQVNTYHLVTELNDFERSFNTFINKVQELNNLYARAKNLKTDNNYLESDLDIKTNYNNVLTNVQSHYQNEKYNQNNSDLVTNDIAKLNKIISSLNGTNKIEQLRTTYINDLKQNNHLSTRIKQLFEESLSNANHISDLNQIHNLINQLDAKFLVIQQKITEVDTIKANHESYNEASNELKVELDNKLRDLLSLTESNKLNVNEPNLIDPKIQNLNSILEQFSYSNQLEIAKNKLINKIRTSNLYSNSLITKWTTEIQALTTITLVKDKENSINQLLLTASNLQSLIVEYEEFINSSQSFKYLNSDTASQNNLIQAINNAKQYWDHLLINNDTLTNANIENLKSKFNSLNGDQRLSDLKTSVKLLINSNDKFSDRFKQFYLSKVQEQNLYSNLVNEQSLINQFQSTLPSIIAKLNQYTQLINTNSLNNEKINYLNSSKNVKDNFEAKLNVLKQDFANDKLIQTDFNQLNTHFNELTTAYTQLNGLDNLRKIKAQAQIQLRTLNNFNSSLISKEIKLINNLNFVSEITAKIQQLRAINTNLNRLISKNVSLARIKENNLYLNSSNTSKQAVINLNNEINSYFSDGLIKDISLDQINSYLTKIDQVLNNLDGRTLLDQAKNNSKQTIDAINVFDNELKQQFKNDIDQANLITQVNSVLTNVNNLKSSANDLLNLYLNNKDLNNVNFVYANQDFKIEFTNLLEMISALFVNNQLNQNNIQHLNELNQQFSNSLRSLNGTINFNNLKDNLKQIINSSQLNDATKSDLTNKLNDLNYLEFDQFKANFDKLNASWNTLITSLNAAKSIKSDISYTESSVDIKQQFDQTLDTAEHFYQNNQIINLENSKNIIDKLNDAINSLNGNTELIDAKNNLISKINNFNQITDAIKQTIISQIKGLTTINSVNDKEIEINQLIQNINQLVSLLTTVENNIKLENNYNWINSSTFVKESLTNQIEQVKSLFTNEQFNDESKLNQLIDIKNNLQASYDSLDGLNRIDTIKHKILDKLALMQFNQFIKHTATESINNIHLITRLNEYYEQLQKDNQTILNIKNNLSSFDEINDIYFDKLNQLKSFLEESYDQESSINQINDLYQELNNLLNQYQNDKFNHLKNEVQSFINKNNLNAEYDARLSDITSFNELNDFYNTIYKNHLVNQIEHNDFYQSDKQQMISHIENVNSISGYKELEHQHLDLFTKFNSLKTLYQDTTSLKDTINYLDSDDEVKNSFNSHLNEIKTNFFVDQIDHNINLLKQMHQSLNGQQRIQNKIQNIKSKLDVKNMSEFNKLLEKSNLRLNDLNDFENHLNKPNTSTNDQPKEPKTIEPPKAPIDNNETNEKPKNINDKTTSPTITVKPIEKAKNSDDKTASPAITIKPIEKPKPKEIEDNKPEIIQPKTNKKTSKIGLIFGVVFGIAATIAAAAVGFLFYRKRK